VVQRPSRAKGTGDEPFPIDPSIDLGAGSDELERAILESFRRSAVDVLGELWEEDVGRLCGERWKPRPRARFARAGWCGCQIVLGGDRVSLRRPRVRSNRGKEMELPSFRAAASRDLLDRGAVEDITATITTGAFPPGRYPREPIAEQFVERLAGRMSAVHAMPRSGFEPGLLAKAHRGFLYIDEVNLLEDHLVDALLDVAASGENVVEREGLSVRHPARFVLVGSGNPEEGELRPQLLDRFGLSVEVKTPEDLPTRVKIQHRRS